MRFIAQRILALGVLFLLSPVWCFPLINELAVSIVNDKFKNRAFTFTEYDYHCVTLEFTTTHILYTIGVAVTCTAGLLFGLSKLGRRKAKPNELSI
jgi:hypothetical protein